MLHTCGRRADETSVSGTANVGSGGGAVRRDQLERLLAMLEERAPMVGSEPSDGSASPVSDEVRNRIERLHDAVRDATDRCQGVLVSKSNRQRLRDALEAERLALEELGFDSYGAFVVATGMEPSVPGVERSGLPSHNPEELDPWLRAQVSTALGRIVTTFTDALAAVRAEIASTVDRAPVDPTVPSAPEVAPDESPAPPPPPVPSVPEVPPVAAAPEAHTNGDAAPGAASTTEEITVTTPDVAAPVPVDASASAPAAPWVPAVPAPAGAPTDLGALVATLHDAAQAMMAGVTAACADAQAAIDRLAEERRVAASEVEAAREQAAAARADADAAKADADAVRQRANDEAEAVLAAARDEAQKLRDSIAQKAREAESRLARLGAEAASVAQQLDL